MQGYIKLHRQLLEWEWYKNIPVRILFEHCLLKANHKDKKWQGIVIKKGSFVTSYENLSFETGLTVRQIRTALDKLKSTNELTHKGHSQYSIITVNNWDKWQADDKQDDKQITSERQASDKRATTTKNDKNDKNEKNNIYFIGEAKSFDPFINPYKDKFVEEYKKVFGQNPMLSLQSLDTLTKLATLNPNLMDLIPVAIEKLKQIKFDIGFKPRADWLLKEGNFEKVINDQFEYKEKDMFEGLNFDG